MRLRNAGTFDARSRAETAGDGRDCVCEARKPFLSIAPARSTRSQRPLAYPLSARDTSSQPVPVAGPVALHPSSHPAPRPNQTPGVGMDWRDGTPQHPLRCKRLWLSCAMGTDAPCTKHAAASTTSSLRLCRPRAPAIAGGAGQAAVDQRTGLSRCVDQSRAHFELKASRWSLPLSQ